MQKQFVVLSACLLLVVCSQVFSQQTVLPYFNGWEDTTENEQWIMNDGMHGSTASNRWYVSSKKSFHGRHSLLISDLGLSADTLPNYSNSTVNIIAARTFTLPKGVYDLSFAWCAYGEAGCDGLSVAWIPNNSDISTSVSGSPIWLGSSEPYKGKLFYNKVGWTVENTQILSTGRPMMLVFYWKNDNKNAAAPSVSIDDIQISNTSACDKPSDLNAAVSGTTIDLSWTSERNVSYEVWYESDFAGVSDTLTGVSGSRLSLKNMPRGAYNIFVRSVCESGDTSIWESRLGVVVNGALCLNYTDFYSDGATCYIGTAKNPYLKKEVDDKWGSGAPPRHTVNVNLTEIDPRTGGNLRVVPEGNFASVRLGNENSGALGEAIEYSLQLDSGSNTVLLMKYAVVLQVPDRHDEDQMPYFMLEILDGKGNAINSECARIQFYSSLELVESGQSNGWKRHDIYVPDKGIMEPLIYKDWTTLGVNLSEYASQGPASIKVRLTTRDCTESAHFGYAYFTLECSEGKLGGITCGDRQIEKVSVPEGFKYRWYLKEDEDKTVVCDSSVLEVESGDVRTYLCDVISKENDNCYFTLEADLMPRIPKAKAKPIWDPENCRNFVRFQNLSYIETKNGISNEVINDFTWEFSDGTITTDRNPVIEMPREGGSLTTRMTAKLDGGDCYDVYDSTFVVPAIGVVRDTSFVTMCRGGLPYIVNGKPYYDTEDVTLSGTSTVTGCDSIHVVRITAVDNYDIQIDTTVCFGHSVKIGDTEYDFSGNFKKHLKSAGGCDSIINLNLTVLPEVTFDVETISVTDVPNSGGIVLKDTLPGTRHIIDGVNGGRLDSLPVGIYTIVCYNEYGCESQPREVTIVAECLEAELGTPGEICSGDTAFYLPITVKSGKLVNYSLLFDDKERNMDFKQVSEVEPDENTIRISVPENIRPDQYAVNVVLHDAVCDDDTIRVYFSILYHHTIMQQKWNDVVALKNDRHNGGYIFTEYQWYKNGQPIIGQNYPYLYLGEGVSFVEGDEVRVEITRADDNVKLMSCPLLATTHNDIYSYPHPAENNVFSGVKIKLDNVRQDVTVQIWDISGVYLGAEKIGAEYPYFTAPEISGMYIIKLTCVEGAFMYKILVHK